jgi:hypothetical protein
MIGRQLIENAPYSPEQLKALQKAFDEACARTAPSVGIAPEAIEAAQLKLADELLDLARHGNFDPRWVADTLVHRMLSRASRFRP